MLLSANVVVSPAVTRTIVYVDGFNLYFGCLKGTPYRWLNVWDLAQHLAPKAAQVTQVRYFTARTKPQPGYPPPANQGVYLRALATLPNVAVHFGEFRGHVKSLPEHPPPTNGDPPKLVKVYKSDEKGSDVNLASYLLLDGFRGHYDHAVIVSNDSDLATPVKMVRDNLGKPITVAFPCGEGRQPTSLLRQACTKWFKVRETVLKRSLFLNNLSDATGAFMKPVGW